MRRNILLFLLVFIVLSCGETQPASRTPFSGNPTRVLPDVASLMKDAEIVKEIKSTSTLDITDGVRETDFVLTLTSGQPEKVFILTVDLRREDITMKVALPDNSTSVSSGWKRQNLTLMAGAMDSSSSQVVAMTNADFWNTSTIVPRGPVHSGGEVVRSEFDTENKQQGASYVGLLGSAGTADRMIIGYRDTYGTYASSCSELTGSGVILIEEGKAVDNKSYTAREPRTAIAVTKDQYVYMMVVDGRKTGVSEGMLYDDMSSIFKALGAYWAVNLDGGGSSQMLVRNPSSKQFEIRNSPSDGTQRSVIDGWAVVKTQ
jgi:exopolysaccharide biosynthesis protein